MDNKIYPGKIVCEAETLGGTAVNIGIKAVGNRLNSTFKPGYANKSVAKMGRDSIMQFPVLASGSVPDNALGAIVKNMELNYANFCHMAIASLNVNLKDAKSTADIIKLIHSNDTLSLLERGMILGDEVSDLISDESAINIVMTKQDYDALAYGTGDEVTTESINSMYQPTTYALNKYRKAVSAMEAGNGSTPNPDPEIAKYQKDKLKAEVDKLQAETDKLKKAPGMGETIKNSGVAAGLGVAKTATDVVSGVQRIGINHQQFKINKQQMKKNDLDYANNSLNKVSVSDMNRIQQNGDAPISLSATIYAVSDDGTPVPRAMEFGVKTMTRIIPSNVMVANLTDTLTTNTWAFQFIKFTKGEIRFFRDIMLGISDARNEAKREVDDKSAGAWFNAIIRRKKSGKLRKWINGNKGNSQAPIFSIIITEEEAEQINDACHMDLRDDGVAAKLMKDMYLLGFAIYNPTNDTISIMYDGFDNGRFHHTNLNGLKGQNKSMVLDVMKEVNKSLSLLGAR